MYILLLKHKTAYLDYFGLLFSAEDVIRDLIRSHGLGDVYNRQVATKQSNITNTIKKFLDDKGNVKDVKGYHKAMYAAENVDSIAKHFYEQGKSDATKDLVAKSKNIKEDIRPTSGDVFVGGLKVKAVSGVDSSKLRIKKRTFNN